jgi:hypothetical protein
VCCYPGDLDRDSAYRRLGSVETEQRGAVADTFRRGFLSAIFALPGYPSVYVNGISDSGAYAGEGCRDRNCTKVALFVASPAGKITFYTLPFRNHTRPGRSTPPRRGCHTLATDAETATAMVVSRWQRNPAGTLDVRTA